MDPEPDRPNGYLALCSDREMTESPDSTSALQLTVSVIDDFGDCFLSDIGKLLLLKTDRTQEAVGSLAGHSSGRRTVSWCSVTR